MPFAPPANIVALLVVTAPVATAFVAVGHVVRKGTAGDPFLPIELSGHQL